MILVVADTGPLNYLIQIGEVGVLPQLFEQVAIPPAVLHELLDPGTPNSVREWVADLPRWIVVRSPGQLENLHLGRGETEAIALAEELGQVALMVDDLSARIAAARRGIVITGTTGVLERSASKGLLDLRTAFEKLRRTNFRGSERLYAEALARDVARRSK